MDDDGPPAKKLRSSTGVVVPIVSDGGMKTEYTIFELQGTLERHGVPFDGEELGALELVRGTPFLTIGIHRLEGKFVNLKKPMVVLDPAHDKDDKKFVVAGIAKRKALFKLRPKILVNKAAAPDAAPDAAPAGPEPS